MVNGRYEWFCNAYGTSLCSDDSCGGYEDCSVRKERECHYTEYQNTSQDAVNSAVQSEN